MSSKHESHGTHDKHQHPDFPNEANLVSSIQAPLTNSTALSINFVTADEINVHYTFLPGCTPATFGCYAAIWQDQNQVPWDNPPITGGLKTVPDNQQSGDFSFAGLTIGPNNYIIGLGVGPMLTTSQKARNVAATAFVPTVNGPYDLETESLVLKFIGINTIAVQYNALAGFLPKTNGSWLACWRGSAPSYTTAPAAAVPITIDANFGTVSIPIQVGVGLTYTVGFFKSGWNADPLQRNQKPLSAFITFTQGASK
jgi:hypothetical protein